MPPTLVSRIAALLVLGLVLTSIPARVWLFGACPVCGQIHHPILVARLGEPTHEARTTGNDAEPPADPDSDSPAVPHDGQLFHSCCPPVPYCSTAVPLPPADSVPEAGAVPPQPDPSAIPLPPRTLIRPPRG